MRPCCRCNCINLRFISIAIGVITTILWIVYSYHATLGLFSTPFNEYEDRYVPAMVPYYAIFICSLGYSAMSTLMVFGAIKRISSYILPWLAIHFVITIFASALSLCYIITFILMKNKQFLMITMTLTLLVTTLLILSWSAVYFFCKNLIAQPQVQENRPEAGKVFGTPGEPTRVYQPV